jgi:hypothetical protein
LWRQDYRQHRGSNRRMPKAERFDFATREEAEAALTEAKARDPSPLVVFSLAPSGYVPRRRR